MYNTNVCNKLYRKGAVRVGAIKEKNKRDRRCISTRKYCRVMTKVNTRDTRLYCQLLFINKLIPNMYYSLHCRGVIWHR